jgi:hypothetical protein
MPMTSASSENPIATRAVAVLPGIGYAVALAMLGQVIMPFVSVPDSPVAFGTLRWRFGYVGILYGTLSYLLLAQLGAMTGAAFFKHRSALRSLGILAAAMAVFLLATLVVFNLDFLQLRTAVLPERSFQFTRATIKADVQALLAAVTFSALAIAAFRMAGALGRGIAARPDTQAAMRL